jgi:glycosyltransferase involved in cell wall biosynthesis
VTLSDARPRQDTSHRERSGELEIGLDYPLPRTLGVGAGTAVFLCGWCFSPQSEIRSLAFDVEGDVQPVIAHGMPRRDALRALHRGDDPSAEDPEFHSYRSGFWGIARLAPGGPGGERHILLRALLADGREVATELGRIIVATPLARPAEVDAPAPEAGPLVAICMATYEPSMQLFRRQVDSIRAQTHRNWVCVISDDCSSHERVAAVEEVLAGDPRFIVSRSPRRLHFYHNFERALAMAPIEAQYVAMADQDDWWHPDKLETLLAEIDGAQLIYSDARIVSRHGELIADTYWSERRNNHSSFSSLLVANSVTGAASLFPRQLLDYALPFPPRQFTHFHDHWLALTARSLGEIAFVDRPLYDYVQHGGAVIGHANANWIPVLRARVTGWVRKDPRERVRTWRMRYFADCCRLIQFTTVLKMRCGDRMSAARRRSVDRFPQADQSALALLYLLMRGVRELFGRPETLGAELSLCAAFVWRRLVVVTARGPRGRRRLDARPPATLLPPPGRRNPSDPSVGALAAWIEPIDLAIREDGPPRVNLLIPTIDLDHFFGGYITKLNLARRLAERGARVRIVTVEPVGALPSSWRERLESYSGLAGLFDTVEVEFGRESHGLEVSRSDRFIATTWVTAYIANSALRELGGGRFLYLIQEHEPFTFPMGTYAALAADSYRFPHTALFSSELLREYFRRHAIGVYAEGAAAGDSASATFENAITAIDPPTPGELATRRARRLLLYARPEPHAARNMFELGVLALNRAVEQGAFADGWELNGIGTVDSARRIDLGRAATLNLLPRRKQRSYAEVLREHDVGLALMYTPHPSLVPIEMASAGMLTVTNSFENKTVEAMTAISSNLITVEPNLDALTEGLHEAANGIDDYERRVRGSEVRWSRGWNESFGDALMDRLTSFLET